MIEQTFFAFDCVEPVEITRQNHKTTLAEKFAVNARKLADILTASGLWQNIVSDLQAADFDLYKYADKEPDFAREIARWNVKNMDFRVPGYPEELACSYHAGIKEAIRSGQNSVIPRFAGMKYDVSFEMQLDRNTGIRRAWYSELYRNCGNGHYYLVIDHERAIHYCKD